MGAKVGGDENTSSKNYSDNSEINVVPFVDVMLVLLIIFMVAAPLATVNVEVSLPKSTSQPTPNPKDPVYVSVQKSGKVYLGDYETTLSDLGDKMMQRTGGDRENRIMIRADKEAVYGNVMRVMNVLQDYGFYKVALVAEEKV
ncbi:MAG: biopolymer transporter ExbD [Alphaproteobacteria bacterium]|nr:biopolymer transporter ExbD [Alphaproteobacteria bacterium]